MLASTVAGRASIAARVVDGLATAGSGLFQTDVEIEPDIGRSRHTLLGFGRLRYRFIFRQVSGEQLLVGRTDFLETLGCLWMITAIRVPAHGQPTIGALQLGRRSPGRDTENFMGIGIHRLR